MNINFDVKSVVVGIVLGTILTVFRASVSVTKDKIAKEKEGAK